MNYILLILILALAFPLRMVTAQELDSPATAEPHPNLHLVARSYGDSIVLRWGAATHTAWKVAGAGGYVIERRQLLDKGAFSPVKVLTPAPIRPLTIDQWKARYRQDDTLAGAAVQALYGSPVVTTDDPFGSIYELYLQQRNMHGFALLLADMAPRIADGLGLRFVDRDIDRSKSYLYRIYSLADDPDVRIDTAFVIVSASEIPAPRSVGSLKASEGEKQIVLKWDRFEHAEPFTGYFIERSVDGGRSFARINVIPFVPADNAGEDDVPPTTEVEYKIPLEANYRPASYRVVGFDAFGELSPGSAVVTAMGRDRTAPRQPRMLPLEVVDGKSMKVTWEIDSADADLHGFIVGKSEGEDGPFDPVGDTLGRDARSWVDRDVRDLPQHYYVVYAIDTAGNLRASVPLLGMFPDSIPPATPTGLSGSIDSNGVVTLRWNAGTESDLKGYRVFFANQEDHEFQQLTTEITADTLFTDTLTLHTLSEEIHYKVTALDQNFNHSPFTTTLTLRKPDVVAPVPPIIVGVEPMENGVRIIWKSSPSEDVVEQTLYRRVADDSVWTAITRQRGKDVTAFFDSTARPTVLYEYSLDASDDAGLRSRRSNAVAARPYDRGIRGGVEHLGFAVDSNGVVLRWTSAEPLEHEFYLYRAVDAGELVLYRSVAGGETAFTDREVQPGRSYRYGVKVVARDGGESALVTTGPVMPH